MVQYKRNQVEEALSRALEASTKPSSELLTRVKRLLELDRRLGRSARSVDPERANYAFFSSDAPGRGTEVWFSDYEAFALMTGLRLLQHGWPQSFAVGLLRRLRPELEQHHARILRQDPAVLFDVDAIRKKAKPGDIGFDNTDPVMLIIKTGSREAKGGGTTGILDCAVCRGMEAVAKFVKPEPGQSWSTHELATPAHKLFESLSKVEVRKRGRGS
jgi:hypothetical protein